METVLSRQETDPQPERITSMVNSSVVKPKYSTEFERTVNDSSGNKANDVQLPQYNGHGVRVVYAKTSAKIMTPQKCTDKKCEQKIDPEKSENSAATTMNSIIREYMSDKGGIHSQCLDSNKEGVSEQLANNNATGISSLAKNEPSISADITTKKQQVPSASTTCLSSTKEVPKGTIYVKRVEQQDQPTKSIQYMVSVVPPGCKDGAGKKVIYPQCHGTPQPTSNLRVITPIQSPAVANVDDIVGLRDALIRAQKYRNAVTGLAQILHKSQKQTASTMNISHTPMLPTNTNNNNDKQKQLNDDNADLNPLSIQSGLQTAFNMASFIPICDDQDGQKNIDIPTATPCPTSAKSDITEKHKGTAEEIKTVISEKCESFPTKMNDLKENKANVYNTKTVGVAFKKKKTYSTAKNNETNTIDSSGSMNTEEETSKYRLAQDADMTERRSVLRDMKKRSIKQDVLMEEVLSQYEEYLCLPEEQLYQWEKDNAFDFKYNEDALEMIANTDTQVWQIIGDMGFDLNGWRSENYI